MPAPGQHTLLLLWLELDKNSARNAILLSITLTRALVSLLAACKLAVYVTSSLAVCYSLVETRVLK
jgi:hypothetical protein